MWPNSYFPQRYYPDRYWPPGVGVVPPIPSAPTMAGGGIDPYLLREAWLINRRKIDRMRILHEDGEFIVLID